MDRSLSVASRPHHIAESLRIVCAEDNGILQRIIEHRLRFFGCKEFTIVGDGVELVEYCTRNREELLRKRLLLIVDINMPRLVGNQATAQIRRIPGFESVDIYACTATVRQERNEEYCKTFGFSDLYEKPLSQSEFGEILRRCSDHYNEFVDDKVVSPRWIREQFFETHFPIVDASLHEDATAPPGLIQALIFLFSLIGSLLRRSFDCRSQVSEPRRRVLSSKETLKELRDSHRHLMSGISAGLTLFGALTLPYYWPEVCILGLHTISENVVGPLLYSLFVLTGKRDPRGVFLFGNLFFLTVWHVFTAPYSVNVSIMLFWYIILSSSNALRRTQHLGFAIVAISIIILIFPIPALGNSVFLRNGCLGLGVCASWWPLAYDVINMNVFGRIDADEREHFVQSSREEARMTQIQDKIISSSMHDLRNQVGGMFWAVENIHQRLRGRGDCNMLCRNLFSSLSFFWEGTDQLTEYFRMKEGRLRILQSELGLLLRQFLRQVIDREWWYHFNPALSFQWEICVPEETIVLCDQIRLRSMIGNLVSNAIKFTSEGSIEVHCSCYCVEQEVGKEASKTRLRVVVQDTGRGMSEEKLQEIAMDPFEGTSRLETDSSLSIGFGVYVHMHIASLMGGFLSHAQNPPEMGGGVTAILEVEMEELRDAPKDDFVASSVLIVDDNVVVLMMVERLIKQTGIRDIEKATCLREARVIASTRPFDCALIDCHLGRERGFELVERKEIDAERIVLMTGDDVAKWQALTAEYGVFGVLRKPLFAEDLTTILGRKFPERKSFDD